MTNAADTPLANMARRQSSCHFAKCSNQDSKSGFGWGDFQALKYRPWQQAGFDYPGRLVHHRSSFRLDQLLSTSADLLAHYQADILPGLSVANIRELLRAVRPLPQLSPAQATQLVIHILVSYPPLKDQHLLPHHSALRRN